MLGAGVKVHGIGGPTARGKENRGGRKIHEGKEVGGERMQRGRERVSDDGGALEGKKGKMVSFTPADPDLMLFCFIEGSWILYHRSPFCLLFFFPNFFLLPCG